MLSSLTTSVFSIDLTEAKYVLDTTVHTISLSSVEESEITAIGAIVGAAQVEQLLWAGDVTPADATVTYQWQRSSALDGNYEDISGATAVTYTIVSSDLNYFFKVVATGTGYYAGSSVTSAAVGPVSRCPITAIGPITGTTRPEWTLTAGAVTPAGATIEYQWERSLNPNNGYSVIPGATSSTYTLQNNDIDYVVRLVVTGTSSYTGELTSAAVGPCTWNTTQINAIGPVTGSARVGNTLSAGALTPTGATATYQWQRSNTQYGTYVNISGATSGNYTITPLDHDFYLRVTATGTGSYSGTVTSAASSRVEAGQITAIGGIVGTTAVGNLLTAGALTPAGATVTYQWMKCATPGGTYTNIAGATSSTYTILSSDIGSYIKVAATGYDTYSGVAVSPCTGPVSDVSHPITGIGAIIGTTYIGKTLTAGDVTPTGATVTYQWQRSPSLSGPFTDISGASFGSYTMLVSDLGTYFRVIATGS